MSYWNPKWDGVDRIHSTIMNSSLFVTPLIILLYEHYGWMVELRVLIGIGIINIPFFVSIFIALYLLTNNNYDAAIKARKAYYIVHFIVLLGYPVIITDALDKYYFVNEFNITEKKEKLEFKMAEYRKYIEARVGTVDDFYRQLENYLWVDTRSMVGGDEIYGLVILDINAETVKIKNSLYEGQADLYNIVLSAEKTTSMRDLIASQLLLIETNKVLEKKEKNAITGMIARLHAYDKRFGLHMVGRLSKP